MVDNENDSNMRVSRSDLIHAFVHWPSLATVGRQSVSKFSERVLPIVAGALEAYGLHLPSDVDWRYMFRGSQSHLTFIPGAHAVPAGWPLEPLIGEHPLPGQGKTIDQVSQAAAKGDPHATIWPQEVNAKVDEHMQAAAKDGVPYVAVVDSVDFAPYWQGIPHPINMTKVKARRYPPYWVVGAEMPGNFGISSTGIPPELHGDVEGLVKALLAFYDVYSEKNEWGMIAVDCDNAIETFTQLLIARGLLVPLLKGTDSPMSRRRLIEGLFWTVAAIRLVGMQGTFEEASADTTSGTVQRALDVMQTDDGYKQFPDQIARLVVFRTVIAAEKGEYISKKNGNVPVDLVYGDGHSPYIADILCNPTFRLQVYQQFLLQQAQLIQHLVATQYPQLHPYLNGILFNAMTAPAYVTLTRIHIPFGQDVLDPNNPPVRDSAPDIATYVPSLMKASFAVLQQLGIDPYNRANGVLPQFTEPIIPKK